MTHPKVALVALTAGSVAAMPASLAAQATVSREVVQALPPASQGDLTNALHRLARDSRDLGALIDAGTASLQLGDLDAAIGFFGRAEELSPGNPRVKVGLAGAFVRSERPLEALRLFEEAASAGASTVALAGDRGLAYDLVGDNLNAQAQYQLALANSGNDEMARRLALSQAIAGNRAAFERTLLPLLEKRDFAAFRARAFGLAMLGDVEEAVAIAEAVMPRNLSAQVVPYLRYMPRLTRAQQAAAANLGIFPRPAQIGRDDPRIAQYSGAVASAPARATDIRLAPSGEPLGPRTASQQPVSASERQNRAASAVERQRLAERRPGSITPQPGPGVAAVAPAPVTISVPTASTSRVAELPPEPRPSTTIAGTTQPAFDLAEAAPSQAAPPATRAAPQISLDAAFADFARATPTPRPVAGGVDITRIVPKREVREPPAPVHPSRIWVQVATGQDRAALKFDWRRIARKGGDLLSNANGFVASWGQTNRLLTGPFDSAREARDMVTKLKAAGVDSFTFTSSDGEQVGPV